MMSATRLCACAQPPHTPQNAISASAKVAAHSARTAALIGASLSCGLPIRLSLKRSSLSLSIARAPYRVLGSAYVDGNVGNPHVDLHVRSPDHRSGDRRRCDAAGPITCDFDARGFDAGSLDAGSLDARSLDARNLDVASGS